MRIGKLCPGWMRGCQAHDGHVDSSDGLPSGRSPTFQRWPVLSLPGEVSLLHWYQYNFQISVTIWVSIKGINRSPFPLRPHLAKESIVDFTWNFVRIPYSLWCKEKFWQGKPCMSGKDSLHVLLPDLSLETQIENSISPTVDIRDLDGLRRRLAKGYSM